MKAKTNTRNLLTTGFIILGAFFLLKKKTTPKVNSIGRIGVIGFTPQYFTITAETTLADLKKQYYKLAKIHHPDTGGTNEGFKAMNNEYEKLQNIILTNGTFTSAEASNEQNISDLYREIIDSIITIPGITIELVGSWIWISGNTFPVKEQIKAAGFKFHSKKSMWFWYPGEYKKHNNKEMEMEDIRKRYGSKEIQSRYSGSNALSGINSLAGKLVKLQDLLIKRDRLNSDMQN